MVEEREPDIPEDDPQPLDLAREVRELRAQVTRLNEQSFFGYYRSFLRFWFSSLFRGLMFGLGSALGATFLLSFLVYMLSSIDFIPVLGEWAQRIIEYIQNPPQ